MRFVADENFCGPLWTLLTAYDRRNSFETSIELAGKGISDEELIRRIGDLEPKPILVGFDRRMLKTPATQVALREVGIHYLAFHGGWQRQEHRAACKRLLNVWDNYVKTIRAAKSPTVFVAVFTKSRLDVLGR